MDTYQANKLNKLYYLIGINIMTINNKAYSFDELSVSAKNYAYCDWLSILSHDDFMPDTSIDYFANMMKGDKCFDVTGECLDTEDDY